MRATWRFDRGRRTFLRKTGAAAAAVAIGPLIVAERTIAALASEASGQRGHFISARAGHSPEVGSSAPAGLATPDLIRGTGQRPL